MKNLSDVSSRKFNRIIKGYYYRNGQQPWSIPEKKKVI